MNQIACLSGAFYNSEQAIHLPPNSAVVKGGAEAQALFKSFWDAGDIGMRLVQTVEAKVSAIPPTSRKYTLSCRPPQSDSDLGNYRELQRRGQWKLYLCDNLTNMPERIRPGYPPPIGRGGPSVFFPCILNHP